MKNIAVRLALLRVSVLVLMAPSLVIVAGQRTVTRTEIRTRIATVTVTRNFVCAKLVNVTGTCRRGRGFLIDEPVILTFDDELDETIENEFHHMLNPQFAPSRTLGVEVTPLVMLPAMQLPNNDVQHSFSYYHHRRLRPYRGSTSSNRRCSHPTRDTRAGTKLTRERATRNREFISLRSTLY